MIDVTALRVYDELDANDNYSVQVGTYHNQAVVVKKYYTSKETDMADIENIRRPWQERRIGPPIPPTDGHAPGAGSTSAFTQSTARPRRKRRIISTASEILTVKESEVLLQQFISVIKFLKRMDVEVSWWQFKPSWAALRQNKHIVLIDWREDFESGADGDFDPRYAIHLMGLGFSDIVPEAFQDLGRSLAGHHGNPVLPYSLSEDIPFSVPRKKKLKPDTPVSNPATPATAQNSSLGTRNFGFIMTPEEQAAGVEFYATNLPLSSAAYPDLSQLDLSTNYPRASDKPYNPTNIYSEAYV
ncbi:hypothetical protein FRC00_011050, partial [Tulasnella sp. 408]